MYDDTSLQILEYHRSMLDDRVRTDSFLRAIMKTIKPGDIVLDLGCGTGLLSYFACIAGARRVYAIEQGPIIELGKAISQHNGFQDLVTFYNDSISKTGDHFSNIRKSKYNFSETVMCHTLLIYN